MSSAEHLIDRYADDIAFVADEVPATTLGDFAAQLSVAAERLESLQLDDGEAGLAAAYLTDSLGAVDVERDVLIKRATELLKFVGDAAAEYRLMV